MLAKMKMMMMDGDDAVSFSCSQSDCHLVLMKNNSVVKILLKICIKYVSYHISVSDDILFLVCVLILCD